MLSQSFSYPHLHFYNMSWPLILSPKTKTFSVSLLCGANITNPKKKQYRELSRTFNMSLIIVLVIGLITAGYFYLKKQFNYCANRGIPNDPPSLLLGNLDGVGTKIHISQNLKLIYDKYKNEHKICGFYLLQTPNLVILDLEVLKNILIKDFRFFADRGVYHDEENDPLSAHLFALDGEKWKKLRRSLSVTFTTGRIKLMFKLAQAYADGLTELVSQQVGSASGIDLKKTCVRFTADVIGSVGFGIECNALKDESTEMMKMTQFFDIRDLKTRAKFFFINVFDKVAKKLKMKLTPDFIEEYFMRVIKSTYEYRMNNDVNRNDFMSLLMKIHKDGKLSDDESDSVGKISFNELAAQAFVFFAAGFETSSTTMQMALFELSYRPELQTKLRNEISEVLARHNGEMSYDAIQEMTYLDQVMNGEIVIIFVGRMKF